MTLSESDIDDLTQVGLEATLAAADYIASQAGHNHSTNYKTGVQSLATQVVTAIDIKSQQIILDKLYDSIRLYDLGLISEELQDDKSRFEKEFFWCIDPLDGTLPFTEQQYGYAVSIALLNKLGKPIIGIVVDPHQKRYYVAIKGKGCKVDGKSYLFNPTNNSQLICHFDRSFVQSENYNGLIKQLDLIREKLGLNDLQIRTGAGAVMNALGLLNEQYGCYIKLPKTTIGGGCVWDFAATSLIFEELGLFVCDSYGKYLKLNKRDSLYMNKDGILFSTNLALSKDLANFVGINI